MSKFIRDNQLDKYKINNEEIVYSHKKKKIKKFKDIEEQNHKLIKKN